jgi:sec-independent protein translocase protein TatB
MEIFNVHIFEFLLIAGLALVIFGPERLPEVGRFLGQQVAKFLAWQQNSPELRMLSEVRGEFEREIAELRDELVRTRQQLDVSKDMASLREDLKPMLDLKGSLAPQAGANGVQPADSVGVAEPTIAPPADTLSTVADATADATADAVTDGTADALADAITPDAPLAPQPAAQTVPAAARPNRLAQAQPSDVLGTPGPSAGDQPLAEPPAAPSDERLEYLAARRAGLHDPPAPGLTPLDAQDQLLLRVQALAMELHALTAELRQRGVIEPSWQAEAAAAEQETIER